MAGGILIRSAEENTFEGTPPFDEAAEMAVLGCIICDLRAAEVVFEDVRPIDFYVDQHKRAFVLLKSLYEKSGSQELDFVELEAAAKLNGKVNPELFKRCMESTPTSANVERYIKIVKDMRERRDLINMAAQLVHGIRNEVPGQERDHLEWSEQEISRIAAHRSGQVDEPKRFSDIAIQIATDALQGQEQDSIGYKFDLANNTLSDMICLEKNKYILLAARTSMGKSTLAAHIMSNVIECNPDIGDPLYFSTEASQDGVVRSTIGSRCGIHSKKIAKRSLNDEERTKLWDAANSESLKRHHVYYGPGKSIAQLRAICKRHKANYGLPLLIVDLAGKLSGPGFKENERLSYISKSLFELKAELDTCLIATVQIGRGVALNVGKRPTLMDLKGSGSWEEDADRVLLVHWPGYYGGKDYRTEIIQAKDRDFGDVRSVFIEYKKAYGTYHKADQKMEDNE